jgi:hypothetical protein
MNLLVAWILLSLPISVFISANYPYRNEPDGKSYLTMTIGILFFLWGIYFLIKAL